MLEKDESVRRKCIHFSQLTNFFVLLYYEQAPFFDQFSENKGNKALIYLTIN